MYHKLSANMAGPILDATYPCFTETVFLSIPGMFPLESLLDK